MELLAKITAILIGNMNQYPHTVLINPDQISDVSNTESGLRVKMTSGAEYEIDELDWLRPACEEFPIIHQIYDFFEAQLDQWADKMYEKLGSRHDYPDQRF